jgi:hypothetical protein
MADGGWRMAEEEECGLICNIMRFWGVLPSERERFAAARGDPVRTSTVSTQLGMRNSDAGSSRRLGAQCTPRPTSSTLNFLPCLALLDSFHPGILDFTVRYVHHRAWFRVPAKLCLRLPTPSSTGTPCISSNPTPVHSNSKQAPRAARIIIG